MREIIEKCFASKLVEYYCVLRRLWILDKNFWFSFLFYLVSFRTNFPSSLEFDVKFLKVILIQLCISNHNSQHLHYDYVSYELTCISTTFREFDVLSCCVSKISFPFSFRLFISKHSIGHTFVFLIRFLFQIACLVHVSVCFCCSSNWPNCYQSIFPSRNHGICLQTEISILTFCYQSANSQTYYLFIEQTSSNDLFISNEISRWDEWIVSIHKTA